MTELENKLNKIGVIPVICLNHPERDAVPLADALCAGGLPAAEITFRAAGADKAIALMRSAHPEMLVGAGTVLTCEQAQAAYDAGAQFLVSPGLNHEVVQFSMQLGIPMLPGVATPTEVEAGMALGLQTLKFFPAEAYGGVKMVKAMAAPYRGIRFMPTGGITLDNLHEYLAVPQILACGGTYMVKESLIESGSWDEITRLCRLSADEVAKRKV